MRRFKIQVRYNHEPLNYLGVEQPDEIFILFPQTKGLKEKIFLIRINNQWSGDLKNKRLLAKIIEEMDHSLSEQV